MHKDFIFSHKGVVTLSPHKYLTPALQSTTIAILMLLLPQIFLLFLTKSFSAIFVILVSTMASVLCEFLIYISKQSHETMWLIAVEQGILIGLLLPQNYPLVAVFFIILFTLFMSKYAFGGFSSSWINPIALCVALCYFLYSIAFPQNIISFDDLQIKNPALVLIQSGSVPILSCDSSITSFLNNNVFKFFKIVIPEGYVSLFWDTGALIPAFRFNLIVIISSIILISLDMVQVIPMSCFMVIYLSLVRIFGSAFVNGTFFDGDVLLALLTSGILFNTLFVFQWYGTIPVSICGKIIYGVLSGVTAFFIIGGLESASGYAFVILIMNIISAVIQSIEEKAARYKVEVRNV